MKAWFYAIVAVIALAGCGLGSSPAQSSAGGTIHVAVYQDASTKIQQQTVDDFNRTSSVKAVLDGVPGDGYQEKLRSVMGTPNAPDVFFNWGGGSIKDYATAGRLVDFGPTFASDPQFKQAFLPSILDAGKIGSKFYGVPMRGTQPVILFYNKDVFQKVGANPPTSWSDVLALVDTFKARGITPFSVAGANAWTEQMWLEYLLDRLGGQRVFARIQGGDTNGWGDPAVLKAAQAVKDLVDRGAFGSNYGSVSYTSGGASAIFAQGKTAMHLMGSWEYANQLSNYPDFAKAGLGWTAFPSIAGGAGDASSVVGNPTNYWSVSAQTKHKDAAIAFVKLVATKRYVDALVQNGDVPTTSNAASLLQQSPTPAYAKFQYDMVQHARSFTLSWDQALPPSLSTPMTTEIQKLFNGQDTPQQFVDAMKSLR
jgi:xylobiose transport system substrate-binding protein